ncbi:MAG: hypothetical protein HC881_06985 [Leptolyngbyaceae cyanobacterium SL_7_1]|nr:hypothetical protein [Leptolyngbyaceae cyanobacterium SL_7_1]
MRNLKTVSLFLYGVEQVLALSNSIYGLPGFRSLNLRVLVWLLQSITGSVGKRSVQVALKLSPTGEIVGWGRSAEALFRYTADEVVGEAAIGTFIPEIETGGRTLSELMGNVYASPEYYSLNVNENQDSRGNRFWMFWVNLPDYSDVGNLSEISCVGFKIDDPYTMGSWLGSGNIGLGPSPREPREPSLQPIPKLLGGGAIAPPPSRPELRTPF